MVHMQWPEAHSWEAGTCDECGLPVICLFNEDEELLTAIHLPRLHLPGIIEQMQTLLHSQH